MHLYADDTQLCCNIPLNGVVILTLKVNPTKTVDLGLMRLNLQ